MKTGYTITIRPYYHDRYINLYGFNFFLRTRYELKLHVTEIYLCQLSFLNGRLSLNGTLMAAKILGLQLGRAYRASDPLLSCSI